MMFKASAIWLAVCLTRQVSGLEMRKWMDELFPIIMDMLQDSSSLAKRQVCKKLKTAFNIRLEHKNAAIEIE